MGFDMPGVDNNIFLQYYIIFNRYRPFVFPKSKPENADECNIMCRIRANE
jgi:hypothetical protein